MVISEVVTLFFYVVSIAFLPEYFGTSHTHTPPPIPLRYFRSETRFSQKANRKSAGAPLLPRSLFRHLPSIRMEGCRHRRD